MSLENFKKAYSIFLKTVADYNLIPEDKNKIVVFYSGGKDASLLVDMFLEYKKDYRDDLEIQLLTVKFPEMIYSSSDPEQQKAVADAIAYWKAKGTRHTMIGIPKDVGDHLFENKDVPCEMCESVKTKIIFEELSKEIYKDSLVCMAHTIEDIGGYFSEIFYIGGQYNHWKEIEKENPIMFSRLMELGKRVYPKYTPSAFQNNITYIKPLIELEEDLIRAVRDEKLYPDIPECCAKLKGEKFKMYKRIVMQGFDWLRDRYRATPEIYDNMVFKNYRIKLSKYQQLGLIPNVDEIEKMKLKSGI